MGLAPLLGRFSLVRGRSAKPHRTAILREFASMPSSPGVNQRGEDVRQEFLPPQTDFEILSTWLTGKLLTK